MPPEAHHDDALRDASPPWRRVLRGAWLLLRLSIIAFALMLLVVRLVVFPRLEKNRDELSRMLSSQIGQPVEIGALVTGWDGWNPRSTSRDLRVLDRRRRRRQRHAARRAADRGVDLAADARACA